MASLYRDSESPFWYLKFKDAAGKWRCKSLRPLRHGIPADTRKAKAKADEHSLEEHTRSPQRESWASWVPSYLKGRYMNLDTRRRVLNAWDRLSEYLGGKGIHSPQELRYADCMDYMPYRVETAAHNTARLELKILSVVCDEAIRRGIIAKNPALKLGIPRVRGKERPELTDDDIAKIRLALKSEPDWMSHAFEIALHQGCRLSETSVFRDDVDLAANRLHFRRTKGDKPFTVPIHPLLEEKLQNLVRVARINHGERIFDLPTSAARDFHRFFQKLKIAGVTFHSTRVTVASRLARSGYPLAKAMRLLNHSSELVHRQYQRLQAEDVADAYEVLRIPSVSDPSQSQGQKSGSRSSESRGVRKAKSKRPKARSASRE